MLSSKIFKDVNKRWEDTTLKIKWRPELNANIHEAFKEGGILQQRLDEMVYVGLEPYVPRKHGTLYNSAQPIYGSGKIIFSTPYAYVQYEGFITVDGVVVVFENYSNNEGGLRGAKWFDEWKQDNGDDVVERLNKIAGEIINGK